MVNYIKEWIKEENGVETIEFIALVAVAAVLIGIVVAIGKNMKGTANKAKKSINKSLKDWDL